MKTDEDIKDEMAQKKYDPKQDKLMPRLFRKFDPAKSTVLSMSRAKDQISVFSNASQYDNNKIYRKGEGFGS